ncbi:MAG: hypothetical protein ILO34_03965 [Kiritimatiellae bacterium]|nr:hypothetical protein [Kiritimatiellia bacterium]
MNRVVTSMVEDAHGYTRAKIPWQIDEYRAASGQTTKGRKFGWKLFHYLAGGGMRAFGRTVAQEERERRQNRFFALAAVLAAAWLALWIS